MSGLQALWRGVAPSEALGTTLTTVGCAKETLVSSNFGATQRVRSPADHVWGVRQAVNAGDFPAATRLARRAYEAAVREPLQLNLLAHEAEEAERFELALGLLREALTIDPNDPGVLHGVGMCLSKMGRRPEALVAFDAALLNRPGYPAAHHHRGAALEMLGDDAAAAIDYDAAARDRAYADPRAGLASVAARAGRGAEARALALEALALDPRQLTAAMVLAGLDTAEARGADAEARLRELLLRSDIPAQDRSAATILMADALDAQNKTGQAFAAYAEGKRLAGELYANGEGRGAAESQRALVARLTAWFSRSAKWAPSPPEPSMPAARHVFLVGFPRSGTTLLEQVLASHSAVVTLDERAALDGAAERYFGDADALARLSTLDGAELARERRAYWDAVEEAGLQVDGKVLVDKFPLNTVKLPVISRLFPKAIILFAERDPRDVVLSAFRRNFRMNPAMAQFTDLGSTARFYISVMKLAELYRERLPITLVPVRHERLVTNFEPEVRRICAALALDWQPQMADFAERARTRTIRTPSAQQVRRGLYADALGQWRRYASELAPVAPLLRPWVERLGYPVIFDEEAGS